MPTKKACPRAIHRQAFVRPFNAEPLNYLKSNNLFKALSFISP